MSADAEIAALAPAPPDAGRSPQQVVDRITGQAKSSFSLGMKLLSRPRREAMRSVYAFCRVVDDIADGPLPAEGKRAMLADWRAEVERLYAGAPRSAIGRALAAPIERHELPKAEFLMMIEGMEMDADGPIVAPPMRELSRYNRRVAGSVGLLSMRIFGAWRGDPSHLFALALADALQMTNILRDVEEDARVGRIYLPAEALARAGVTPDCATIADDPGLPEARAALGGLARAAFDRARGAIPRHSRLRLAPALAMLGVYEGYLDRMEAAQFGFRGPLEITRRKKFRLGLAAVALAGPRRGKA
jgi:presqualene diphosphate synthase